MHIIIDIQKLPGFLIKYFVLLLSPLASCSKKFLTPTKYLKKFHTPTEMLRNISYPIKISSASVLVILNDCSLKRFQENFCNFPTESDRVFQTGQIRSRSAHACDKIMYKVIRIFGHFKVHALWHPSHPDLTHT